MDVIFYNIEDYSSILKCMLSPYFLSLPFQTEYYDIVANQKDSTVSIQQSNQIQVLFYLIQNQEIVTRRNKLNKAQSIYYIAICKDYEQGIQAVRNGSDYALQIPLQEDKVKRCAVFLVNNIKKSFS